ncbi:hypothetical protein ACC92_06260 [Francisella tularensis subsp. holarctica]|nr:hypothetical protein NE061598_06095 [Francisella tularensis subsp. tularensis NE061598]ORU06993.1 hypothetical protein ACC94_06345 [Francisella tularensis subsp. holarctica]ORU10405.1 hypothetical protein ACC92_06260 [Francisella tularensis subsp. holarctica]
MYSKEQEKIILSQDNNSNYLLTNSTTHSSGIKLCDIFLLVVTKQSQIIYGSSVLDLDLTYGVIIILPLPKYLSSNFSDISPLSLISILLEL